MFVLLSTKRYGVQGVKYVSSHAKPAAEPTSRVGSLARAYDVHTPGAGGFGGGGPSGVGGVGGLGGGEGNIGRGLTLVVQTTALHTGTGVGP